jgi:hypothetical protein
MQDSDYRCLTFVYERNNNSVHCALRRKSMKLEVRIGDLMDRG